MCIRNGRNPAIGKRRDFRICIRKKRKKVTGPNIPPVRRTESAAYRHGKTCPKPPSHICRPSKNNIWAVDLPSYYTFMCRCTKRNRKRNKKKPSVLFSDAFGYTGSEWNR